MGRDISKLLPVGLVLLSCHVRVSVARDAAPHAPPPQQIEIDLSKYDPAALDATKTWHLTRKIRAAVPSGPVAPSVDGYNDPNAIRYDEARLLHYLVDCNPPGMIDGVSMYEMTTKHGNVLRSAGIDSAEFGTRFHYKQCIAFLAGRAT